MHKIVLPFLVILLIVSMWLLMGRVGLWDKTGKEVKKHVKETMKERYEENDNKN